MAPLRDWVCWEGVGARNVRLEACRVKVWSSTSTRMTARAQAAGKSNYTGPSTLYACVGLT